MIANKGRRQEGREPVRNVRLLQSNGHLGRTEGYL
jgi:hypothetical protein